MILRSWKEEKTRIVILIKYYSLFLIYSLYPQNQKKSAHVNGVRTPGSVSRNLDNECWGVKKSNSHGQFFRHPPENKGTEKASINNKKTVATRILNSDKQKMWVDSTKGFSANMENNKKTQIAAQ